MLKKICVSFILIFTHLGCSSDYEFFSKNQEYQIEILEEIFNRNRSAFYDVIHLCIENSSLKRVRLNNGELKYLYYPSKREIVLEKDKEKLLNIFFLKSAVLSINCSRPRIGKKTLTNISFPIFSQGLSTSGSIAGIIADSGFGNENDDAFLDKMQWFAYINLDGKKDKHLISKKPGNQGVR